MPKSICNISNKTLFGICVSNYALDMEVQCTYIINLYIFSGDWSLLSLSTKAIGHDKLRGCDYISRNLRTSQTTKICLQLHFGEFHESDEPTNESTHLRAGM